MMNDDDEDRCGELYQLLYISKLQKRDETLFVVVVVAVIVVFLVLVTDRDESLV